MTIPAKKKEQIAYYKTNLGLFIRNLWGMAYNGYSGQSHFNTFRFNGVVGNNTLYSGYMKLEGYSEITKVEKFSSPATVQTGYTLRTDLPEAVASSLPKFYSLEDVNRVWGEDEDEYSFGNKEFQAVRGLYTETFETKECVWKEIEFEPICLGDFVIENFTHPEKMLIKQHSEGAFTSGKIESVDLSSIVCYNDIERIVTPEFMLHTRPCTLTSDQVYKIVRAHIKENINPRCAEITSDYDFCFTVKRKIHHKPVTTRTEIKKDNGRSYVTPRFNSRTVNYRSVEIFEMTSSSHRYNKYTVIQGWVADNLEDMKNQVKVYLDMLMDEINKEVEVCSCCNGVGAVVNKLNTNKRP